jgi:hypothetical protein
VSLAVEAGKYISVVVLVVTAALSTAS